MPTQNDMLLATSTVAELTGATVRQVDYWARSGLLKPSGKPAHGKGSRRCYTFQDLVALTTVVRLRERGCPLQKIRTAVKHMRKHFPAESDAGRLTRVTMLTNGKQVYILTDEQQVMEVVTQQHVWAVPLGLVIQQARQQVHTLPTEWTEEVVVDGEKFHLTVVRDVETDTFTVACRELPGAIEQGDTVKEAIGNGIEVVRSVLAFQQKRKHGRTRRRVKTG